LNLSDWSSLYLRYPSVMSTRPLGEKRVPAPTLTAAPLPKSSNCPADVPVALPQIRHRVGALSAQAARTVFEYAPPARTEDGACAVAAARHAAAKHPVNSLFLVIIYSPWSRFG